MESVQQSCAHSDVFDISQYKAKSKDITARWLSELPEDVLVDLARYVRIDSRISDPCVLHAVKELMIAEDLPATNPTAVNQSLIKLGECASLEYAYRQGWVEINGSLALNSTPSRRVTTTSIGRVMKQAMGPESVLVGMVKK